METTTGANGIRKMRVKKKNKKPALIMSVKFGLKSLIFSGRKLRAVKNEEEYDDFDERCAALPLPLLLAVKRAHLAMDLEKYKEELERRALQEPMYGILTRGSII